MSKLDFEQRHRLETEVLPAVIDDPEYAAATIVRLESRLADNEVAYHQTLEGPCWPDEKHCACVPHLRRRVDELEEALLCYGQHEPGCRYAELRPDAECTCGLEQVVNG